MAITAIGNDFVLPRSVPTNMQEGSVAPSITSLANGNYAVVWVSATVGFNTDLRYTILSSGGTVLTEGTASGLVNGDTTAFRAGNGLAIVSSVFAGNVGEGQDEDRVEVQVVGPDGVAAPVVPANQSQEGDQDNSDGAALGSGRFIAVWESEDAADSDGGIRGRLFDANGSPVGNEFLINTTLTGQQQQPVAASLSNGGAVIAWYSPDTGGGDSSCIRMRVIGPNGAPTGNDIVVDAGNSESGSDLPSVVGLAGGKFAVVYSTLQGFMAKIFNANGSPSGGAFLVASNAEQIDTAALADGRMVAVWKTDSDFANLNDIYMQTFSATGQPEGQPIKVNSTNAGLTEDNPSVSVLNDGTVVVAWTSDEHVYDAGFADVWSSSVRVRRFDPGEAEQTLPTPTNGNDNFKLTAGNDVFNALAGNDIIDGLAGNDTINGAAGNDRLFGGAGNDRLVGETGNDVLNGGLGADVMIGGAGNDVYVIDNAGDRVAEAANGGIDTVNSAITFSLAALTQVEKLVLTGARAINATGNALANTVTGNAAANVLVGAAGNDVLAGVNGNDRLFGGVGNDALNGGLGNDILFGDEGRDTLTGGAGADSFVFNKALVAANADRVADFAVNIDKILLDNLVMAGLGANDPSMNAPLFHKSVTGLAHDANDRIIYETDTGALWYDRDGTGSAARQLIATLGKNLALDAADFVVI